MTNEEAVSALDALGTDGEECHAAADRIILACLPQEVADAYELVQDRADFWAFA